MTDAADSSVADALRDRFALERELSRGGMGLVFVARDLRHNRLVALKVIRPDLASVVGAERFCLGDAAWGRAGC